MPVALAEVEEAFETTEAFWAARRTESSRVRRFTWAEKHVLAYQGQRRVYRDSARTYHSLLLLLELQMQVRSSQGPRVPHGTRARAHARVVAHWRSCEGSDGGKLRRREHGRARGVDGGLVRREDAEGGR